MSGQDGKGTNFPKGVAAAGQPVALSVLIGSASITPSALTTGAGATSTTHGYWCSTWVNTLSMLLDQVIC
jgi:hypothetical protein